MDKLKLQSFDVIGSNIQKIQQLFPNCVTERLSKDGKPELAIDFQTILLPRVRNAINSLGRTSV